MGGLVLDLNPPFGLFSLEVDRRSVSQSRLVLSGTRPGGQARYLDL